VGRSVAVLTRPQAGQPDRESLLAAARATPLPVGPTAWPVAESAPEEPELDPELDPEQSATADEGAGAGPIGGDTVN
jgi:hypothetical protein